MATDHAAAAAAAAAAAVHEEAPASTPTTTPTPTLGLAQLPAEIIQHIAFFVALTPTAINAGSTPQPSDGHAPGKRRARRRHHLLQHGHAHSSSSSSRHRQRGFVPVPYDLPALTLTCTRLHSILNARSNPGLYARLFRFHYDTAAIHRRFGAPALHPPALAAEYTHRAGRAHQIVTRARASEEHQYTRNLWMLYLLLLENDGRNTRILQSLQPIQYLDFLASEPSLPLFQRPSTYPSNSPGHALALHIRFLLQPIPRSEAKRAALITQLRPFVFAAQRFDAFFAPWTYEHLPLGTHARATRQVQNQPADRRNTYLADLTPVDQGHTIPYCGSTLHIAPPNPVHAACQLFFNLQGSEDEDDLESFSLMPPSQSMADAYEDDDQDLADSDAESLDEGDTLEHDRSDAGTPRHASPSARDHSPNSHLEAIALLQAAIDRGEISVDELSEVIFATVHQLNRKERDARRSPAVQQSSSNPADAPPPSSPSSDDSHPSRPHGSTQGQSASPPPSAHADVVTAIIAAAQDKNDAQWSTTATDVMINLLKKESRHDSDSSRAAARAGSARPSYVFPVPAPVSPTDNVAGTSESKAATTTGPQLAQVREAFVFALERIRQQHFGRRPPGTRIVAAEEEGEGEGEGEGDEPAAAGQQGGKGKGKARQRDENADGADELPGASTVAPVDVLSSQRHPRGVRPDSPLPNVAVPQHHTFYTHSRLHDGELKRLTACLSPYSSAGLPALYFAGQVAGTWEGTFAFFDFDSYREMLFGRISGLFEGQYGHQAQVWKLEEKVVPVRRKRVVLDSGRAERLRWRGGWDGIEMGDDEEGDEPEPEAHVGAGAESTEHDEEEEDDMVEVDEVAISGVGHSAWGHFVIQGRIRPWDGLVTLVKEYRPDGRGRWRYRGYLVAGERLVGRWRDTFSPPHMVGYEGVFLLKRREGGQRSPELDGRMMITMAPQPHASMPFGTPTI